MLFSSILLIFSETAPRHFRPHTISCGAWWREWSKLVWCYSSNCGARPLNTLVQITMVLDYLQLHTRYRKIPWISFIYLHRLQPDWIISVYWKNRCSCFIKFSVKLIGIDLWLRQKLELCYFFICGKCDKIGMDSDIGIILWPLDPLYEQQKTIWLEKIQISIRKKSFYGLKMSAHRRVSNSTTTKFLARNGFKLYSSCFSRPNTN